MVERMTPPNFRCEQFTSSGELRMFCLGPSMYPTLRPGDTLHVQPYAERPIRSGDVVAFIAPISNLLVVHRIVRVDRSGMITRGDNNLFVDEDVIRPEDIIGKVAAAERDGRKFRIVGAFLGLSVFTAIRLWAATRSRIVNLLGVLMRRPFPQALVRRIISLGGPLTVIRYSTGEKVEFHLVQGRKIIGKNSGPEGGWKIRFPYRLCMDHGMLMLTDPPDLPRASESGPSIATRE
jgi:signal peptidase I